MQEREELEDKILSKGKHKVVFEMLLTVANQFVA